MKTITKILMATTLLFLIIGIAAATDTDNMKSPNGFEKISGGIAKQNTDKDTYLYIGKLSDNEGLFENNTEEGYGVSMMNDKIYVYIDTLLEESGVQEIVNFDGEQYVISISKGNWVGDVNNQDDLKTMETFHNSLKEFNKLNNLEPVEA